jgi:hypothetical protein
MVPPAARSSPIEDSRRRDAVAPIAPVKQEEKLP